MGFHMTDHVQQRARQRGVTDNRLQMAATLADRSGQVGRSLYALRISHDALVEAREDGWPPQELDRIKRFVLVESADGALVTCAHLHGRKSRAYGLRQRRKFWKE